MGTSVIAETARLLIRHLSEDDIEAISALWSDPEVTRFMGGPREFEKVRRDLRSDLAAPGTPRFDLWPVIEKATGIVVGHCGLLDKVVEGHAEIELVYVLARSAWGRGFATEAGHALCRYSARTLGCNRLISLIDPANQASRRVAERLGMTVERKVSRQHRSILLYSIDLKSLSSMWS